jgi:colanic acid/amylovoran biosynthesis glycosyltransferase
VVVSCRGAHINVAPHNPDRAVLRDGLRDTFARAAAVHCVSEEIKQEATHHGLDPARAWIIRPAVDPERFRPSAATNASDGPFRVVTTGSLIWRKGHEYALIATRLLLDRGFAVQFDIIGAGPERQRLLYTIHDLDLEQCVTLHGSLNEEAVSRLLQQADAFLLSSLSEGISNAVLEAMACGLPVVTTNCGGMGEAVTDGVEGFLVPVREPHATAEALARLASDRSQARRMGAAARDRVLRQFTMKQQIQRWLELYHAVVSRPNSIELKHT